MEPSVLFLLLLPLMTTTIPSVMDFHALKLEPLTEEKKVEQQKVLLILDRIERIIQSGYWEKGHYYRILEMSYDDCEGMYESSDMPQELDSFEQNHLVGCCLMGAEMLAGYRLFGWEGQVDNFDTHYLPVTTALARAIGQLYPDRLLGNQRQALEEKNFFSVTMEGIVTRFNDHESTERMDVLKVISRAKEMVEK